MDRGIEFVRVDHAVTVHTLYCVVPMLIDGTVDIVDAVVYLMMRLRGRRSASAT